MNANIKTHHDVGRPRLIDNRFFFFLLLMVMFVSTLVGYMYIRNALDALISRNLAMKSSNAQLQQEIIYLESEVIDLSRPGNIQKIAKEQLGMVASTPQAETIFIKKKK